MTLIGATAALFDLSGRVAVVTGATRGIGAAIAWALAEAGASVVVSSENQADCDEAASGLRRAGHAACAIPCDLERSGDAGSLIDRAQEGFGRLDMLVCSGGIEGPVGPMGHADDAAIDRTLEVNLRSALRLSTAAAPVMAELGGGSIVLISSIAGLRGNRSIGIYGISKAAQAQLARNLAVEWGSANVRVNAISPGLIETGFSRTLMSDRAFLDRRLGLTPLRRAGRPQEIAGAALFLLSDAGAFVTGQNIVVDGGTLVGDGS